MNRNAKIFSLVVVILSIALMSQTLGFNEQTVRAFSEQDVSLQGPQNPIVVFTSTGPSAQNQAMSNESVGWKTYEDSQDGYKIQYPQEWKFVKGLFSISTDFSVSPDSEDISAVETSLMCM